MLSTIDPDASLYLSLAAKDDAADFRDVLKHRDKQKRIKEEEEREKINLKPLCKYLGYIIDLVRFLID